VTAQPAAPELVAIGLLKADRGCPRPRWQGAYAGHAGQ
jgi:hypothetical protein